jgi:hypothetical protein
MATMKPIAAEKSSIEEAVHDGLITQNTAGNMIEAADQELDKLTMRDDNGVWPHCFSRLTQALRRGKDGRQWRDISGKQEKSLSVKF